MRILTTVWREKDSVDDLWADAFNDQQATEKSPLRSVFKSLEAQDALGAGKISI